MASRAIPSHLKPGTAANGGAEGFSPRHHGKTQSHMVSRSVCFPVACCHSCSTRFPSSPIPCPLSLPVRVFVRSQSRLPQFVGGSYQGGGISLSWLATERACPIMRILPRDFGNIRVCHALVHHIYGDEYVALRHGGASLLDCDFGTPANAFLAGSTIGISVGSRLPELTWSKFTGFREHLHQRGGFANAQRLEQNRRDCHGRE
jgi:hypothetical protein